MLNALISLAGRKTLIEDIYFTVLNEHGSMSHKYREIRREYLDRYGVSYIVALDAHYWRWRRNGRMGDNGKGRWCAGHNISHKPWRTCHYYPKEVNEEITKLNEREVCKKTKNTNT